MPLEQTLEKNAVRRKTILEQVKLFYRYQFIPSDQALFAYQCLEEIDTLHAHPKKHSSLRLDNVSPAIINTNLADTQN